MPPAVVIVAGVLFLTGTEHAIAAPSTGQAQRTVVRQVRARYPKRTATRQVLAHCRKLHRRVEFSCRYGVHATLEDAAHGSGRWVFSGLADVKPSRGRLRASLIGPLTVGGQWAPFDPEQGPPVDPSAIRHEEEASEQARRAGEQRQHEEEERLEAARHQFCEAEPSASICS